MRARRFASVAVTAALGAVVLSGCGHDPAVDAYVGSHRYSQATVDGVVAEIKDLVQPEQLPALHGQVVQLFVVRDVANRYAKEHNITVPAVDPDAYAQQNQLPPGKQFTALVADVNSALTAIESSAPSVAPSEADQREAHSHLSSQGQPVTESFDEVRQYLGQEQLGRAVGFRDEFRKAIAEARVRVNPRYGQLAFRVPAQIGQVDTYLGVPLDQSTDVVTDLTKVL